ncbi:ATP-binding protein [Actinoplanes oblitus]|uniref:Sensor-like histidine kinase SenX3 n=1 Tax=Actinoplanes oblitus TaxID=3040509 RepID=A0ABY8WAT1_9ACTN|nr:ATP-binding protein [Actinoplanes oblitus]WIM94025.1 ATP-binding protein [Actinoplanes oblitus]
MYRRALARTALFTLLYAAAVYAGRKTAMVADGVSLVWPAAGVAVVWYCAIRGAPTRHLDMLLLAVILGVGNWRTGASAAVGVVAGLVGLIQVGIFRWTLRRWRPHLWGAGGTDCLRSPPDLWALFGAGLACSIGANVASLLGRWLVTGSIPVALSVMSVARHMASILIFGAVGIFIGAALSAPSRPPEQRPPGAGPLGAGPLGAEPLEAEPLEAEPLEARAPETRPSEAKAPETRPSETGPSEARPPEARAPEQRTPEPRHAAIWRAAETATILTLSILGQVAAFTLEHRLPLSFMLLGFTVVVGARLRTPWVLLHSLVVSLVAIEYTLLGSGPFAQVGDVSQRAVIVQLFCILATLVGLSLSLARDERRVLLAALAQEKAELETQRRQAAHHADLLTAIIDSMADGLAVIGPDRRVVLHNPAVVTLLGSASGWQGLYHPDGTPFDPRALAGEEVTGVDLLVRNPAVPDGRVVRVTATSLLHPDGTRSAVVLFHDVTAERRHRDELTNFAGVVAHDLLNPLASIEGWTAAAQDVLGDVPEDPNLDQGLAYLARLSRASARMRGLIDGLLAYTTAREAAVAPVRVELNDVVADICLARTDAAVAAGKPEPVFDIGTLPPVQADPVLVRQLLDNLIGNAIKYTAPGVIPTLRISAVLSSVGSSSDRSSSLVGAAAPPGGMVTVRIADNGIGIPEGQHDAIFGNFHRAHAGGGYLGTGLGLAICKRIVERHGGAIAATDNPDGGSCFAFTLPAAVTPATATPPVLSPA